MSDVTLFALLFSAFGPLLAAIAVPLMQSRIKPNPWYGFRTRKTLSDPAIWYPANRVAGRDLLLVGIAITLVALAVLIFGQSLQPSAALAILVGSIFVSLGLALWHGAAVLRKL